MLFDVNKDVIHGPTVYYNSIFMGHELGYQAQQIIVPATVLNPDTTSDDDL